MARKVGTKFSVVNSSPSGDEASKLEHDLSQLFRPEHWEFRKAVQSLYTENHDLEPAQWILKLMEGTYDEYGTKVSKFIPFMLEYFVDRTDKRTHKVNVCCWIIVNWWYFWGYGPKPSTKGKPKTRTISVIDNAWTNGLKCPVCNRMYDVPKGLTHHNTIIDGYTKWLIKHVSECQEPISKYQQRKEEKEKLERRKKMELDISDYSKRQRVLSLEGDEAKAALKAAVILASKLERQNKFLQDSVRDRDYFAVRQAELLQDAKDTAPKYLLTQKDYWEVQQVREAISSWTNRKNQLSEHLEIRGTKTQVKAIDKILRDLVKREKDILLKAGITK